MSDAAFAVCWLAEQAWCIPVKQRNAEFVQRSSGLKTRDERRKASAAVPTTFKDDCFYLAWLLRLATVAMDVVFVSLQGLDRRQVCPCAWFLDANDIIQVSCAWVHR
jgi:hypothetical protein